MENSNAEIFIFYGSQTGTAKYVAERLNHMLLSNKYIVSLNAVDSFDITQLPSVNYAVFIVSTIGYGQCPNNMKQFWNFIMQKDLPSILSDLNYTIFGLGDSSYEKFNYCARALNKRLTQLGADSFFQIGLGDEQHDFGYEGEFDYWSTELISALNKNHFPFHSFIDIGYHCKFKCEKELNDNSVAINNLYQNDKGRVTLIKYITAKDAIKQVVRINIDIDKNIIYSPGDIISIYPENSRNNIDFFMEYYQSSYQQNDIINIYSTCQNGLILKCTFEELFGKYLDISSIPKRHFCIIASRYTDNELHKEKLKAFGGDLSDGKGEFFYYCNKEKRTFVDFLSDFSSVKLPLDILIQEIGFILPRELSISSSPIEHSDRIELTLGIVDYYTELKRHKQGLLSKYIVDSIDRVPFAININFHKGTFQSIAPIENVLLIATGTGIAPIRSYLIQRNHESKNCSNDKRGKTLFVYGCRNKSKDDLYNDELNEQSLTNLDIGIYKAFSRDGNSKVYVQNMLLDHSSIFIPLILSNCTIIIVGNSKFLPKAVKTSIMKGIMKEKEISEDEAIKLFKAIENKIHIESW